MKGHLLFRIIANYCGVDMDNSGIKKEGIILPGNVFDGHAIKYAVYNTCRTVKKKAVPLGGPAAARTVPSLL